MYGYGDDILVENSQSDAPMTRVSMVVTTEAASQLELAAFREGMTEGELVQHMLQDYFNHTGVWG